MTSITHALIIDEPWISRILAGEKTWELRTTHCHRRGWIGLIRKGSGQVVGIVRLVNSHGELSVRELLANQTRHRVPAEFLDARSRYRFAWELAGARALTRAVHYRHPRGAVIWVELAPSVRDALTSAL